MDFFSISKSPLIQKVWTFFRLRHFEFFFPRNRWRKVPIFLKKIQRYPIIIPPGKTENVGEFPRSYHCRVFYFVGGFLLVRMKFQDDFPKVQWDSLRFPVQGLKGRQWSWKNDRIRMIEIAISIKSCGWTHMFLFFCSQDLQQIEGVWKHLERDRDFALEKIEEIRVDGRNPEIDKRIVSISKLVQDFWSINSDPASFLGSKSTQLVASECLVAQESQSLTSLPKASIGPRGTDGINGWVLSGFLEDHPL